MELPVAELGLRDERPLEAQRQRPGELLVRLVDREEADPFAVALAVNVHPLADQPPLFVPLGEHAVVAEVAVLVFLDEPLDLQHSVLEPLLHLFGAVESETSRRQTLFDRQQLRFAAGGRCRHQQAVFGPQRRRAPEHRKAQGETAGLSRLLLRHRSVSFAPWRCELRKGVVAGTRGARWLALPATTVRIAISTTSDRHAIVGACELSGATDKLCPGYRDRRPSVAVFTRSARFRR